MTTARPSPAPSSGRNSPAFESRIIGRMREMETALVSAFHSYATGVSVRFRKIEADVTNIDAATMARLAALEDRVLEVERRLPRVV